MDIQLYFLPQFEPFQPYLAGAVLASAIKKKGWDATYHDLNLAYYMDVLGKHSYQFFDDFNDKRSFFFDEYKYEIQKLEKFLHAHVVNGKTMSFYESGFGDLLFQGSGLRDIVASEWGDQFFDFLEKYFASNTRAFESKIHAFTIVVHDQLPAAILVSKFLRIHNPRVKIIWGGSLVSRIGNELKKDIFLRNYYDKIVAGAGEPFFTSLYDESKSLCAAKPSHFYDINDFPDFTIYPLDRYISPYLVLPYLTSRGCYWGKCVFCSHFKPFDQYVQKEVSIVVDQLKYLSDKHKTKYFSFSDEAVPLVVLKKLSYEIIEKQLDIRWFTFARLESGFDEKTCSLLYEAGCRVLMFGLESASRRILNLMNKGIDIEGVVPILHACKYAGISIRLDIMIGFPTETKLESEQTLQFLLENKDIIDTPFSVTPLSKFELQAEAIMQGHLSRFGVRSLGKRRGALDYQHKYHAEAGMTMDEVDEQYRRFVQIISKDFIAHSRMPENKTHSFLLKCIYAENNMEEAIFDDRIEASRLNEYKYECLYDFSLEREGKSTWILYGTKNGGGLRIGQGLAVVINEILQYGSVAELPEEDDARQQIAEFLTYLNRQGFLKARCSNSSIGSPLLRV